ncbi:MAG: glycosyltransferase [Clostridia bacterium]|nr:glycosyltransferase [Clostridia bacterium]
MEKRAVCVSCFDFYDHRVELVMDQLRSRGYKCTYITGDFSHFTQQKYTINVPGGEQVPTIPYYKNMSVARVASHHFFAKAVFKRIEEIRPDFLYLMVPPNSLSLRAGRYKKKHPKVKLVLDLYDLWPETFPNGRAKKLAALPFKLWGLMRDKGLKYADLVYTECDLYRHVLKKQLKDKETRLLPICRETPTTGPEPVAPDGPELSLCYLGSIGKLLDIDALTELLRQMAALRPVNFHIIGEGETRAEVIRAAEDTGAHVMYYGRVYDPQKRQAIFDQCHFGINIMKTDVCVGLTMKSLDYFAGGLPIINGIEADTRRIIRKYDAGIELDRGDIARTAREAAMMTAERNTAMRRNTLRMFEENFSAAHVRGILSELE